MSQETLIKNATIVNENKTYLSDVLIKGERIAKVATGISATPTMKIVEAEGQYLLPGMIDAQVHFREPGLTHKGNIRSESRAAVAGGITSFMEMPNVNPNTTTIEALEDKFQLGQNSSLANYSFYLGATEDNLEEIKRLDPTKHCGVKVFMGASTGTLLVEDPVALEKIFSEAPTLIATHCESGPVIRKNLAQVEALNRSVVIQDHPIIRNTEACYASSSYAVDLAKRNGSLLHVLHITSAKELALFSPGPIEGKAITAEACVHHLWFNNDDYERLGNAIKCNPAIKFKSDQLSLIEAVQDGRIDIIATDHAPHTWQEKSVDYPAAPAGLPLVQHALQTLFDQVKLGRMKVEDIATKVCHNPAIRYGVTDRGYIREGYYADLVLVDMNHPYQVSQENILYYCEWSPFVGHEFGSSISRTWVNGQQVFDGKQVFDSVSVAKRLEFRSRR